MQFEKQNWLYCVLIKLDLAFDKLCLSISHFIKINILNSKIAAKKKKCAAQNSILMLLPPPLIIKLYVKWYIHMNSVQHFNNSNRNRKTFFYLFYPEMI